MIPHCLDYANKAKEQGRPVVGIMCEYTPREVIFAAGAELVLDLIEGHDGLVVAQENCTGLRPLVEDVDEGQANPLRQGKVVF